MNTYSSTKPAFIHNIKIISLVLSILIITSGCANQVVHKKLSPDLERKSLNLAVYSYVPYQMSYSIPQMRTYGGGVIGALIGFTVSEIGNAIVRNSAQERISKFKATAAKTDFRGDFWKKLEPTISDASWFKFSKINRRIKQNDAESKNYELPTLILWTNIQMSPNFQYITINTKASLYIKSLKEPDYFAWFTFYSDKIGKNDEEKEEAIALWSANDAAALHRTISAGIDHNMNMMRYELLNDPSGRKIENGKQIDFRMLNPDTGIMWTLEGTLVEKSDDRILMRESGGNLFSISTSLRETSLF